MLNKVHNVVVAAQAKPAFCSWIYGSGVLFMEVFQLCFAHGGMAAVFCSWRCGSGTRIASVLLIDVPAYSAVAKTMSRMGELFKERYLSGRIQPRWRKMHCGMLVDCFWQYSREIP